MSFSASILLETCAAIWLAGGPPMSVESREAITAAQVGGHGIHVSPMTAWEIATLVAKGLLTLSLTPDVWFSTLLSLPGLRLSPMPPNGLIALAFLPGSPPKDTADRIIATTGRTMASPSLHATVNSSPLPRPVTSRRSAADRGSL